MGRKKRGLNSGTKAVTEAGRRITSTRMMWEHQLKRHKEELRLLEFHLNSAVSYARKAELSALILKKQQLIDDVRRRLRRCKKPGSRPTGFIKVTGGGRADGND